jgi:hypothetical protein
LHLYAGHPMTANIHAAFAWVAYPAGAMAFVWACSRTVADWRDEHRKKGNR